MHKNLSLNGHPLYHPPPPPPLFITLPHAHAHSLWGGPLTRLSICLTPTSFLLLFFPQPPSPLPSPAHTLASALLLLLPCCHLPRHNREGKTGKRGVGKQAVKWGRHERRKGCGEQLRVIKRESRSVHNTAEKKLSICSPSCLPSPPDTLPHTYHKESI